MNVGALLTVPISPRAREALLAAGQAFIAYYGTAELARDFVTWTPEKERLLTTLREAMSVLGESEEAVRWLLNTLMGDRAPENAEQIQLARRQAVEKAVSHVTQARSSRWPMPY